MAKAKATVIDRTAPEPEVSSVEVTSAGSTEGDVVEQALKELHFERQRQHTGPRIPAPNKGFIYADPHVGMAYNGMDVTPMLGDARIILKNPRPGCKYIWKKKADKQTAAWVRSGVIRPVEPDEVDTTNPLAQYVEDVTSGVPFVMWDVCALFEMPPKWVKIIYDSTEERAIARVSQQPAALAAEFEEKTRGAYSASLNIS